MNQDFIDHLLKREFARLPKFPDKAGSEYFIERLYALLFIPSNGSHGSGDQIAREFEQLQSMLSTILIDVLPDEDEERITAHFFSELPSIYASLRKDADAFLKFDPAAGSIDEVLLAYPGFFAISVYRFSHILFKLEVPVLPRVLSEYAHSKTGIDIHPGATIGESFFVDHGTGVVIGESTLIGNNVIIYQGVTLGALHVAKELAKIKRHPTIEDNVIIYSGATILGGDTVVGRNSIIGGNVWLTESVLPSSVVYQKSEVIVRDKNPLNQPLNFVI